MRLFGTVTSPYVRRVRIVASELGLAHDLVDVNAEVAQAELRRLVPTWKIPAVQFGDTTVLWDSGLINDVLIARHGWLPALDTEARQRVAVIDAGLDAAISLFYMKRDGVDLGAPYLQKQRERIDAAMAWVTGQVEAGWIGHSLTLDTIALVTTLDWFALRGMWTVEHTALLKVQATFAERPSFVTTRAG